MNERESVYVEIDVAPSELVGWLHALADHLSGRFPVPGATRGAARCWVVGPRDYSGPQGAPVLYETLALYAAAPIQLAIGLANGPAMGPPTGDVALSVTIVPLHQRGRPPGPALELRRWSPLPAALDTVVQHLIAHFGKVCTVTSGAASPQELPGAPPLACNRWLEAQLAALPPRPNLTRLYRTWLEQYRALRGDYPVDPQRSFRAAVIGCRRRLAASK
jgi:hypothetical protein